MQTCRLYYTSYDIRRESDTIHLTTRPDIILRAPPPDQIDDIRGYEPFWYARVIGIHHVKVYTTHTQVYTTHTQVYTTHTQVQDGGQVRCMKYLWVWWFGSEPNYNHGFHRGRLPKIGFVPSTDDFAFGFCNPDLSYDSCICGWTDNSIAAICNKCCPSQWCRDAL